MVRHPFTIFHVARELDERLRGMRIMECFVHRDDTVVFRCEGAADAMDVEVYFTEPIVAVSARTQRGRPRHHTHDVFPQIRQARIQRVFQPRRDRVLVIETTTVNIVVRLYSGGRANVLCVDEENRVVDCLKERDKLMGREQSHGTETSWTLSDVPPGTTVLQALSRCTFLLGPVYADEVCRRSDVDAARLWDDCTADERDRCSRIATAVVEDCLRVPPNPVVCRTPEGEEMLSLIDLRGHERMRESPGSVLVAVEDILHTRFRERRTDNTRRRLSAYVERELRKAEKAVSEIQAYIDRGSRAQELRYKADLLLSTPDVHRSGDEQVVLTGWSGEDVTIPLDPKLQYAENAQAYYARARRAEVAARTAQGRSPKLEARCAELRAMRDAIREAVAYNDFQIIMKKENLDDPSGPSTAKKADVSPYRVFELAEGWTLYVGRSAQNNDELTMKFAKQKDLWLHARGVSGSHAVLRSSRSTKPPKNVLETAAAIVAYYSKARNAKYTPVVYTQRSHVRKPKGAAVGAVILEREDTIMVSPGLPAGYRDSD